MEKSEDDINAINENPKAEPIEDLGREEKDRPKIKEMIKEIDEERDIPTEDRPVIGRVRS